MPARIAIGINTIRIIRFTTIAIGIADNQGIERVGNLAGVLVRCRSFFGDRQNKGAVIKSAVRSLSVMTRRPTAIVAAERPEQD